MTKIIFAFILSTYITCSCSNTRVIDKSIGNKIVISDVGVKCSINVPDFRHFYYTLEDEIIVLKADFVKDTTEYYISYLLKKAEQGAWVKRVATCKEASQRRLNISMLPSCATSDYVEGTFEINSIEYYYSNYCNSYVASCITPNDQSAQIIIQYAKDLEEVKEKVSRLNWAE